MVAVFSKLDTVSFSYSYGPTTLYLVFYWENKCPDEDVYVLFCHSQEAHFRVDLPNATTSMWVKGQESLESEQLNEEALPGGYWEV